MHKSPTPSPALEEKLGHSMLERPHKAESPRNQVLPLLTGLLVLVLVLAIPAYLLWPRPKTYFLKTYTAATVARATITESVSGNGTVVSAVSLEQKARGPGRIDRLFVSENLEVQKGQPLLHLQSPALQSAFDQAQQKRDQAQSDSQSQRIVARANTRRANLELAEAGQTLDRSQSALALAKQLYALGGETRYNLLQAEQNLQRDLRLSQNAKHEQGEALVQNKVGTDRANAALTFAENELRRARNDLIEQTLYAPVHGRVVRLAVQVGDDVVAGTRLLTVLGLERLRVDGQIDPGNARRLRTGQSVRIDLDGVVLQGEVDSVGSEAISSQNGSMVTVQVRLSQTSKELRPGTLVNLEYLVGKKTNVLSLPQGSYTSAGPFVYVLQDGRAERYSVRFGSRGAERLEALDGLKLGDRVITSSYEDFKDFRQIDVAPQGELK